MRGQSCEAEKRPCPPRGVDTQPRRSRAQRQHPVKPGPFSTSATATAARGTQRAAPFVFNISSPRSRSLRSMNRARPCAASARAAVCPGWFRGAADRTSTRSGTCSCIRFALCCESLFLLLSLCIIKQHDHSCCSLAPPVALQRPQRCAAHPGERAAAAPCKTVPPALARCRTHERVVACGQRTSNHVSESAGRCCLVIGRNSTWPCAAASTSHGRQSSMGPLEQRLQASDADVPRTATGRGCFRPNFRT